MDERLVEVLISAKDDPETLQELLSTHGLNVETVEVLKTYSAHFYFDCPSRALQIAEAAYRLSNLLPNPAPALGRWTLANALLFADRYQEAATLFDQARADYLALGRTLDAARMGVGHIWALAYTGQFERALKLAAEIEPVLAAAAPTDPADLRRLGGLFNNIGIIYDLMGQYEESLAVYERKLEITRALNNSLDAARTQHNRACALIYLNAFDEALAAFKEAEAGFLEAGAKADLARLAYNRGTLYARWGRYAEAETDFATAERWLSNIEGTEQARAALTVYRALARLRSDVVPDAELLNELNTAQVLLAAHGPLFEEGLAWLGLGHCYLALGDLTAAQKAFEQALSLGERGAGRPVAWEALHGLGNLAKKRNDLAAAIELYERAISHIEAMRQGLRIEAFRAGFLGDKLIVYQDLAQLYARMGRLEDAFSTVERSRSRVLAERLASRLRDEAAELTTSEDPGACVLAQRLQEALKNLERLYNQASSDNARERGGVWPSALVPTNMAEIEQAEQEVLFLVQRIERLQPVFSPLTLGYIAPVRDIRTHLQDVLLLQYHIARGRVWAFIVDSGGIRAYQELVSLTEVESARRRLSAAVERVLGLSIHHGLETVMQHLRPLVADAGAQVARLYDLLFRPLVAYLPSYARLIISPDGPLHYVPFHALFDGKAYLAEKHIISYIPSATLLDLCARRASGQGMLIIGYSGGHLKQIANEMEAMAEMFPQATLVTEGQATAERLLAEASGYRVLHLATHARFRADNPMLSSLYLADRQLTLAEIARLRLNADLVTLSGCETGHGRLRGADLISLACGFLGAGARSLLVSLWRVDDATTAQLMKHFYQALRTGAERASALRAAQLKLLTLGREQPEAYGHYCHPAYWAPFILMGEWRGLSLGEEERCTG